MKNASRPEPEAPSHVGPERRLADDSALIEPQAVPLSHTDRAPAERRRAGRRWPLYAAIGLAAVMVTALFTLAPQWITPVAKPPPAMQGRSAEAPRANRAAAEQPPPFAALRREQARAEASAALARFVELELRLRDELNLGQWGQEGYDEARNLAQAGDEAFVAERFEQAIGGYRQAADALAVLLKAGHAQFDHALAEAVAAIDARRPEEARAQLDHARQIRPDDAELAQATARAARLPELLDRFRQARNHELAGRWADAVQAYEGIRALDAAMSGLTDAIAEARRKEAAQRLRRHLSSGFAALERQAFSAAQRAFEQALAMDPNNSSALGGLQQIAEQSVLVEISRLKQQATTLAAAEQWREAADAYRAIMALDANIQFARTGLQQADAQRHTLEALHDLLANADRLSADAHYRGALDTLQKAKQVAPQGPLLSAAIGEADALLQRYGNPVPVLLRSDNATEVLLSNIGPLGRFSEKRLHLRPGAYTLIGSRDGCRDVRAQITVAEGMAPIDIRCREALQQ